MKEYKNYLIGAGAVVLVLVVIFGFSALGHKKSEVAEAPVMNTETISNPTAAPQKVVRTKKPVAPKMSYAEALKTYSNGYRIQFDNNCQAFPRSSVYSNGTTIMLDNRTDKEQAIKIGANTYKVSAYGYELAKLTAAKSPTEYLVDCGSQQNPASIIIE